MKKETGEGTLCPSCGTLCLSETQMKVLRLRAQGFSFKEIARAMSFSVISVKRTAGHIYDLLQAENGVHAITRAFALGLLKPEEFQDLP